MKTAFPKSVLHIIVYAQTGESRSSISNLGKRYKGYLLVVKRVKPVYVELGGLRSSQTTELWVVPKGADLPKPTPTEKFRAEIFAEFGNTSGEFISDKLEKFYVKLQQNPTDQAYIINYGSAEEVKKRELQIRDSIRFRHIRAHRITIISAEGAILKTVLWLVPEGAKPPTP